MGWVSGILRWFGLGNAGSADTGGLVCATAAIAASVTATAAVSKTVTATAAVAVTVTATAELEDC